MAHITYLDNFVGAEVAGNKILYRFKCVRCSEEYLKSTPSKNIGLCPSCKAVDAKKRAKLAADNAHKKAKEEVKRDLKKLVSMIEDSEDFYFVGKQIYINKNTVLNNISAYFNQQ